MINSVSCGKVSRLLSKSVGQKIEAGVKVLENHGVSVPIPQNAQIYDSISGIGKKGKFQLFSFKNEQGQVVQQYTRFFRDNNDYLDETINIDSSFDCIYRVKSSMKTSSGKREIEKVEHSSMLPLANESGKRVGFQKSFMTMTPTGDFGGQEILRPGKKSIGIKFNYNWDGQPAEIEYKNTLGKKLDLTETESQYLPFINRRWVIVEQNGQQQLASLDFTPYRVEEKIGLAQIIQEKLHGIKEGLLPKAKAVTLDDLVCVKVTGKTAEQLVQERGGMLIDSEAIPNGQINIAINVPNGTDGVRILQKMAHEVQHEADNIAKYKGGDEALFEALNNVEQTLSEAINNVAPERCYYDTAQFEHKCLEQNGIFLKGTPEYAEAVKLYEMDLGGTKPQNLTDLASHDAMPLEQRAINREQEQINFLNQIGSKIGQFLSQFLM